VLAAVADAFAKRPVDVEETAAQVREFLNRPSVPLAVGALTPALLDEAAAGLARDFDAVHGGFGGAPKFPQPMLVEVLLRHHVRTGQAAALDMALQTLRAMAAGGIHDQLGGGFHRYAVDGHWLVPHFEKMLYDNALLSRAYLDAWQLTHDPDFRSVAEDTLAFVLREMTSPEGSFYSSLDADSEGEEGRFYLWTPQELEAALGADQAGVLAAAFDVTAAGNFEGRNILHPVASSATEILDRARERLLAFRSQRVRPHRDEKVIAGWNGLMLRAVADAGRVLDRPDFTTAATANADFLLSQMRHDGRMRRSYKDGRAPLAGYLEDQAAVADGLLALYEATFDPRWLDDVRGLVTEMVTAFWDQSSGAFFDTARDQERLVARPQDVTDNAIPSGTSLAVDVLLRAGMLLGQASWVDIARATLERLAPTAAKAPLGFGRLLEALDFHLGRTVELAVIGEPADPQTRRFLEVVRERFVPNRLVAVAPADNGLAIPLLADRHALDGKATAYLCEGFVCQAPTHDASDLARQLDARMIR
jgi:hypothetical protein